MLNIWILVNKFNKFNEMKYNMHIVKHMKDKPWKKNRIAFINQKMCSMFVSPLHRSTLSPNFVQRSNYFKLIFRIVEIATFIGVNRLKHTIVWTASQLYCRHNSNAIHPTVAQNVSLTQLLTQIVNSMVNLFDRT